MANFTLTSNKGIFISAAEQKAIKAMTECGIVAAGYAKDSCPVDTGRLRNSITYKAMAEGSEAVCYIGTNVEYGIYVEMGTVHMEARPYLKPAAANHTSEYQSILKAELNS